MPNRAIAEAKPESAYVGSLDGLRAIAVAAVIVYHFSPAVLPAGFLGVDVFFVVSGFLISRLVTREIARTGTVGLTDFWKRRARRLLPALATVTVVVLVAAAIELSNAEIHDLRAQALGTLFYCANWVIIFAKGSYFTSTGRPSPFLHMWTLAVEEQFYVVLPLVLFAARRIVLRRPVRAAGVAMLGAVASTVWMGVLFSPSSDPSRAYLGSDSHAMGLLVGVALGVLAAAGAPWDLVVERLRAGAGPWRFAPALGGAALVALLAIMRVAHADTRLLYRGGFLVFAVLCAIVLVVVVTLPDTALTRLLRTPALVAIGLRSYSLYLWHWPVRVFVTTSSGLDGFALFAVRLLVSVVLAELSFRCVEQPFRRGRFALTFGSRAAVAYFAVLTVVAGLLVVSVAAPKPLPPSDLAHLGAINGNTDPNALRVDTFGDSTALVFGISGAQHAQELDITVGGDAQLGCGVVHADHVTGSRVVDSPPICAAWRARWQKVLHDDPHARLALMTGAWEILDQRTSAGLVRFGTTAWTDLVTTSLRAALSVLTSDGRTVYVFEVPCYGDGDVSAPFPERSDPKRIAALNTIYENVAHSMDHVAIVHWRTLVCPDGHRAETVDGVHMWQADDQHLTDAGGVVVWKWWLPQIR
jgi:peptidoglycan/LPS O-acetylase OafA/YrhL